MFINRQDAARQLAQAVVAAAPVDPVVLALPRGGAPLGAEIAGALGAPLDLMLVRKIGMPGQPELAAGAIVDGAPPVTLFNDEILRGAGLTPKDFAPRIDELKSEIAARRAAWLAGRAPVPLAGRTAILVDDGVATGATARVALRALRAQAPGAIWLAIPVAPADMIPTLRAETDHLICLAQPDPFWSVGAHYRDFAQVPDAEVARLMQAAEPRG